MCVIERSPRLQLGLFCIYSQTTPWYCALAVRCSPAHCVYTFSMVLRSLAGRVFHALFVERAMAQWFLVGIAISLVSLSVPMQAQERGKLGDFEESVKEEERDKNEEKTSDSNGSVIGDIAQLLFSDMFLQAVVGVEKQELADGSVDYSIPLGKYSFTEYPYALAGRGMYSIGGNDNAASVVSAHYMRETGRLYAYSVAGRFSPVPFLSFEGHYTGLYEKLFDYTDNLTLYSVFLNYHSVRSEHFSFLWGLGLQGLKGWHNLAGFAVNVATDWYPLQPMSVHLSLSAGLYTEFLGTLNVHVHRVAFFAGWQSFTTSTANIGGIVGGVQVYF